MCSGKNNLLPSNHMKLLNGMAKSYSCPFRYFPPVVKIKDLIESGIIGKVVLSASHM